MPEVKSRGELGLKEPHPSARSALEFVLSHTFQELTMWQESFASCAIEGNRLAEVCGGTLNRLMTGQIVSDRYILGLAWAMQEKHSKQLPCVTSSPATKSSRSKKKSTSSTRSK